MAAASSLSAHAAEFVPGVGLVPEPRRRFVRHTAEAAVAGTLHCYFFHSKGPWPASDMDAERFVAIDRLCAARRMRGIAGRFGLSVVQARAALMTVLAMYSDVYETDGRRVRTRVGAV